MTAPTQNAEWLAWRQQGIGASDIAGILGVSPWTSPYQVWFDKTQPIGDDQPTVAMRAGNALEDLILDLYEEHTGNTVTSRQERRTHPEHPWMRCTLDGATDTPDQLTVVEAKSSSDNEWDEPPIYYYTQGQAQMAITGANRCDYPVLHNRNRFEIYETERDNADIASIIEACATFWHDHVLTRTPPAATGNDLDTLKDRWTPDGTSREVDHTIATLVAQLQAAKKQAGTHKTTIDDLQARLLTEFAEHEHLTYRGRTIATWKPASVFDAAAAAADHPEIAAKHTSIDAGPLAKALGTKTSNQYRHPTGSRRLTLKVNPT